ncbi:receptor-like protein 7 isoform X1 [Tasmannia lanceolata]|uniref:receptor-like protein 7 isoform X1 n=1 Tax=Tasmannia lanceolata TaxID=3420 RepID=UPI004062B4F4
MGSSFCTTKSPAIMRFLLLPLLSFLLFHSQISEFGVSGKCNEDESASLLQLKRGFYISTDSGLQVAVSWNWKWGTDCCNWEGVTCDESGVHVIGLDLSSLSINGTINSTALIGLSNLRILNLSYNKFNSIPIPSGLDHLSKLTHLNLSYSGFIGQIPEEISRMKSLISLDLSTDLVLFFDRKYVLCPLVLQNPNLKQLIQNLSNLKDLSLSRVNTSAQGHELSFLANFSSLVTLDLRSCGLQGEFPASIFNLHKLQTLDISYNRLLSVYLPEFSKDSAFQVLVLTGTQLSGELPVSIGNLKSLVKLQLGYCNLSGSIPYTLENLTQLVHLDLSSNNFTGSTSWLANLIQLVYLDLSSNNFTGSTSWLANLTQLVYLDMASNNFTGSASWLANLTQLVHLELSDNNFSGELPFLPQLEKIMEVYLDYNHFTGAISSSLFTLPSLHTLVLSDNQLDGQLSEFPNAFSSLLEEVDLSNNKLQGPIPMSLLQLPRLEQLRLSSNNFNGMYGNLTMYGNHKKLLSLDLSGNSLSIDIGVDNSSFFPQFLELKLGSCNLSEFPYFLRNQNQLVFLDLSNNKIRGEIPTWIWNIPNFSLNLSHNMLTGIEPYNISSTQLEVLDLHSNMLQGSIPLPPPNTFILDYSNNNFTSVIPSDIGSYITSGFFFSLSRNNLTGEIPPSFCDAMLLVDLDLSNNGLNGSIPQCLVGRSVDLHVLNLGGNFFSGTIPQTFADSCNLRILNLNENQLEGHVPTSLGKCRELQVLDLGNNMISDTFPSWLWNMSTLAVLILRNNRFYGPIGDDRTNYAFQMLQIIDLSSNGFTGNLPSEFFKSWKLMTTTINEDDNHILGFGFAYTGYYFGSGDVVNDMYYQFTTTVTNKGQNMELPKILTVFKSLDLSQNQFHGDIPEAIGELNFLHMLNMSGNNFTGQIPKSFGNLSQLESLDLSRNKLSGEIPQELTSLTFLSMLDLSKNFLVGRIPQDRQFSTFENSSFEGNPGLCGTPLSRKCENSKVLEPSPSPSSEDVASRSNREWSFIPMGLGYGVGLGIVAWFQVLRRR